jgi:hypothetical protein
MDSSEPVTSKQQVVGESDPQKSLVDAAAVPPISVAQTGVPELSPSPVPALENYHWDFAAFEEEYIRSYIALADTKAAWVFTVASGLLAYLFSRNTTQLILLQPRWSLALALLLLGAILLIISAFHAFRVVAPRLTSPSAEGVIFFGAVAAQPSADAYVSNVASKDKTTLTEARLKHCYDVSRICNAKYRALKKAIWLGVPGLALSIGHLLLT